MRSSVITIRAASSAMSAAALLFFVAGCGVLSTETYKETNIYDLGIPKNINKPRIPVSIGRFRMLGPYKSRMVLRHSGNRLDFNDYKKWSQSPGLMLSRYLKLALETPAGAGGKHTVSGTILVFEADESTKTISLMVVYDIKKRGGRGLVDSGRASFSTKVDKVTSESISNAMSANAAKFADLILKELAKASTRK
ncbi:MAG: hypothetical protein GXP32_04460 [Kiritimatiellaeota bacterium]|nr:hypothetical protein [Kiritimatiellota bacterium]